MIPTVEPSITAAIDRVAIVRSQITGGQRATPADYLDATLELRDLAREISAALKGNRDRLALRSYAEALEFLCGEALARLIALMASYQEAVNGPDGGRAHGEQVGEVMAWPVALAGYMQEEYRGSDSPRAD